MNDSDCPGIFGFTASIVSGIDYVACRSFCGSAKGKQPCKSVSENTSFWNYLKGDIHFRTKTNPYTGREEDEESWGKFLFPNLVEMWFPDQVLYYDQKKDVWIGSKTGKEFKHP
jgi:hypothetical protein